MLSWSHRLKRVSEERAGLARSVSSIFNAVFSRLWMDRSLGYLTDNTQPPTLSISLTATLTLTVKPFSLGSFFFLEYCTFMIFFILFLTVKYFWMNNILNLIGEKKTQIQTLEMFFLFHSVYQLYAHVLCMFQQKPDEIL